LVREIERESPREISHLSFSGVAEVLGGLFLGKISDLISRKIMVLCASVVQKTEREREREREERERDGEGDRERKTRREKETEKILSPSSHFLSSSGRSTQELSFSLGISNNIPIESLTRTLPLFSLALEIQLSILRSIRR
jgi:hypothetical protein